MRYVRDTTGRFPERPHYDPKELDTMFERVVVEFLKHHRGKIEFPISTDDLTVLIEQEADDLDPYADLSGYGRGVEGVTEFTPGRHPRVRISEELANAENKENRFRTTLTHEFGHVKLHGYLFALGGSGSDLFAPGAKPQVIACKRDTIITASRTDWMEWQAGYACGAVLMPGSHARAAIQPYHAKVGIYGPVAATGEQGQAMIDLVVDRFQVSRDAARVRLSVLGILGSAPAAKSLFG
jgi:hypothetical protein